MMEEEAEYAIQPVNTGEDIPSAQVAVRISEAGEVNVYDESQKNIDVNQAVSGHETLKERAVEEVKRPPRAVFTQLEELNFSFN